MTGHRPGALLILLSLTVTAGCLSATTPTPAPDFTLTTLEGDEVTLATYEGRLLLLDFMGTTCGPCQVSMPHWRAFANAHPEVAILSVGVDPTDTPEDLALFKERFNASWPFAPDTDEAFQRYGARGIPTLYVIDGEGRIVERHDAKAVTRADLEDVVRAHGGSEA